MTRIYLGRHVLGLAAILFGIVTLVWHDFNNWQQIQALGNVPHREILAYIAAAIELLGGLAIQWTRTARAGAVALGSIFFVFALLWVPHIVAEPRVYDRWGNLFEQFSQVASAVIVYATLGRSDSEQAPRAAQIGYILFGICVVSFTLERLFNFLQRHTLFQSGFLRDKCSGRLRPQLRLRSRPSRYCPGVRPF